VFKRVDFALFRIVLLLFFDRFQIVQNLDRTQADRALFGDLLGCSVGLGAVLGLEGGFALGGQRHLE